jgi:hypothetical protein
MPEVRRLSARLAQQILAGTTEHSGLFEQALGFKTATKSIKVVHVMNDLAQCVFGGAPAHGGDLLCRIIRQNVEGEDNSEVALRRDSKFGAAFDVAYPANLGSRQIALLRDAAAAVLNADGGMYEPGTSMASGLATHRDLLGFEGFRRFRVGSYLAGILNEEGRRTVRELYTRTSDPVTRALQPIVLADDLVDKQAHLRSRDPALSPFDISLGRGLTTLLRQPLSKPTLLRYFSLGASLGVVLKVLGIGRSNGRPVVLAAPDAEEPGAVPLREQAVVSWNLNVDAMDDHLARLLPLHPLADQLWRVAIADDMALEIPAARNLTAASRDIVAAMRSARKDKEADDVYWPDAFAAALGAKAGCVLPKRSGFGWGKRLTLNGELAEVLILMFVQSGTREPWRSMWKRVRDHLGIVVGVEPHADADILEGAQVRHVSLEHLATAAEILLESAVRRGVARTLPDSGAEVGGDLS